MFIDGWRKPISGHGQEIVYVLGRWKVRTKSGKEFILNYWQMANLYQDEKENNTEAQIEEIKKERLGKAKQLYKEKFDSMLINRTGLKGHKGYYKITSIEEIEE